MSLGNTRQIRVVTDEIAAVFDDTPSAVVPDFEPERIFQRPPVVQGAGCRQLPDERVAADAPVVEILIPAREILDRREDPSCPDTRRDR